MLLLQVAVAAVLVGVVAALLTKGTVALTGRLGGQRVSRVLADAEYIVEHTAVPPAWRDELAKKHDGLQPGCSDASRKERHQALAKRACLRRLDKLITFSRKTSVVADEEAREILVSELVRVDEKWRSRGWDEMTTPSGGPS